MRQHFSRVQGFALSRQRDALVAAGEILVRKGEIRLSYWYRGHGRQIPPPQVRQRLGPNFVSAPFFNKWLTSSSNKIQ